MKEINNKTMGALILLALIVTVSGTLLVLNELEDNSVKQNSGSVVTSGGEVTLTINTKEKRESEIAGKIILEIN
jgi:hypothetical protein